MSERAVHLAYKKSAAAIPLKARNYNSHGIKKFKISMPCLYVFLYAT